uniref:Rhodopsin domain-containing protein n=1 Tax=Bionectria ochroleuca TaxID=29856 RepID=A0A8H7NLY9_BIOOC
MPPSHPDKLSSDYVPLLACSAVFTFLSLIVVVLRFIQRIKIRSHWYDDWTIFASLVFAIGMMATTVLGGTRAHAGYAADTYSHLQLGRFSKIFLAYNVIYNWSIMTSKLSILFFYYRILVTDTKLQRLLQCVGGAIIATCIAVTFALIFSNNPIQGQWEYGTHSTAINSRIFWISTAALNLVFDIAVLMAPRPRFGGSTCPSSGRAQSVSSPFLVFLFAHSPPCVWHTSPVPT